MDSYKLESDLTFKADSISEAREILEIWIKHICDKRLTDLKQRVMLESRVSGHIELVEPKSENEYEDIHNQNSPMAVGFNALV